jgi:hypothetical protein
MDNKYVTLSFDYLRGIPAALAEIFKNHAANQLKIRNKERLSSNSSQNDMFKAETDKKNEFAASKDETLKKLADIGEEAKSKEEMANRHLDRALGMRAPSGDVQQNLLTETREQKAWERIKPILDRHSDVDTLASEIKSLVSGFILKEDSTPGAYDGSDFDSVSSLRKELPFYIKGRSSDAEAGLYLEQSINALEEALADIRPEYREAVNLKKELRTGMVMINTALTYVKHAVENNELEVVIPTWTKGDVLTLA